MWVTSILKEAPINSIPARKISLIELSIVKETLIYSHMAATAAWRDERQGVVRHQRGGCDQIGRSLASMAWCQSPGYDLRRTHHDLPDLTCNAAHGGMDQRFLKLPNCQSANYHLLHFRGGIHWN